MSDSLFYSNLESTEKAQKYIDAFEEYSEENSKQVYIIDKPLSEDKYSYEYKDFIVVLIPKHKIMIINLGIECDDFEDFIDDFIEDLGHISDKYNYKSVLGRPRKWREKLLSEIDAKEINHTRIEEFLSSQKVELEIDQRKTEFLISLLTGSINDIDKVGGDVPTTLLDKVKKNIILFDGDQTKFIYEKLDNKRVVIQGLAGTGKTELLLHKLKEIYTKEGNSKIVFTCHNKILAQSLKDRIPEFFNFMKVDEQIEWESRLWAMGSWGSRAYPNSGLYSFICAHYGLNFQRFSRSKSFGDICFEAIGELEVLESFEPYFDNILIDESQDFTEGFFALCEKVTKGTIYVAGDIFQNVFDENIVSEVNPDYLLNKCYRTDPKTLMFSHAIGMGLFEKPNPLRWLEDKEWEACGYQFYRNQGKFNLTRKKLRRFEDLEEYESVKLIPSDRDSFVDKIIESLVEIYNDNKTVEPEDIGIVFLENQKFNYDLAAKLEFEIQRKFRWRVNIGYESKTKEKNALFISNRNNVKGLEFPFVIVVSTGYIPDVLRTRNSLYMMMTRSFIKSYLVLSDWNEDLIPELEAGLQFINNNKFMSIDEPSDLVKEELHNAVINDTSVRKSLEEQIEEVILELGVEQEFRNKLKRAVSEICEADSTREDIIGFVRVNHEQMKIGK